MKTLSFLLFVCMAVTIGNISMAGIMIGNSKDALKNIKLKVVAEEGNMTKYTTDNGNDFSVTTQDGKVVYMENDWLQNPKGTKALIDGFEFGTTSLKDLRKKFGTNGFTFTSLSTFTTETHAITLNCFEVDSPRGEVFVAVTKVPLNAPVTEENIAELFKLDAIIVADMNYLNELWGEEKIYDPNHKKIKL